LDGYGGPAVVVAVSADPDGSTIREWDGLVERTPGSDVAQLSAWATIRRGAGFRPLYLFAHQNFEPLSPDYIQTSHRELDAGRHAALFVAELDGSPVATLLCTLCGGVVKQRLAGMDRSDRARREGVAAATRWHAMMWAKENQYRFYDFGGISSSAARILLGGEPEPATRLSGPELFKTSFGGEVFRYPEPVELIPSPPLRVAYAFVRRTRAGRQFAEVAKRALRGGRRVRTSPVGVRTDGS
jgi:lipid II:glycine glycyltransferase (peptidoglycan interpeptide bridge formation enzyme)